MPRLFNKYIKYSAYNLLTKINTIYVESNVRKHPPTHTQLDFKVMMAAQTPHLWSGDCILVAWQPDHFYNFL